MTDRIARAVTALLVAAFSLAFAFVGWWPTTVLLLLTGATVVATAASFGRFPRLEWHLSSWLLAACVIAIGIVAFFTIPDLDSLSSIPEQTREENEAEFYRIRDNRADHRDGIGALGLASIVAAVVLETRRWRVREPESGGFRAARVLGVI